ncbi:uncharacterized protein LOC9657820 [Selaginella moellendorffii]|uniref:uncharacterized protein LOC9657820 n=1 Tax=Selaginella moellendorffii TaxID=88036 RepID=UPI000D1C4828|nr:uncharacterized protein LOC9657820 [Selaginella moellendorffii]|eukprot:XP_024538681.1 uncharacterized protein LOC9657820 [Selaginella moellendorffii]
MNSAPGLAPEKLHQIARELRSAIFRIVAHSCEVEPSVELRDTFSNNNSFFSVVKGAGCFPTKAKAAKIDEAKAEGAASSSHIWGKTNPLKFPAYLYTKGVFKANHPLIKIVSGEELMPAFDKFALPLLVDAQVRRAAIFLCSTEFTRFYKLYGKASNEKQLTEFHHSLVRELEKLTIPSGQTLKKLEGDQLLYESLTGKKRKRTDLSDIASFSDQLDMLLQVAEERISQDLRF